MALSITEVENGGGEGAELGRMSMSSLRDMVGSGWELSKRRAVG